MIIPDNNQPSSSGFAIFVEKDGLPHILERVDGIATNLNAIGFAIIEAGFKGVRSSAVAKKIIVWQSQLDTPEGVLFALLCEDAKRGNRLPSVEQVLELIRPFRISQEGN